MRNPVASASSSARRSGPFVLGPSGSPTPSRVVSGHLGDDHSRRSRLSQGTECSRQPTPGSRLQGNLARAHEEIPRLKRPSTRNSLKPEDRQPQLSSLTDQQNTKSAAENAVPTRRRITCVLQSSYLPRSMKHLVLATAPYGKGRGVDGGPTHVEEPRSALAEALVRCKGSS